MSDPRRPRPLSTALLGGLALNLLALSAAAAPQAVEKPQHTIFQPWHEPDVLGVKFRHGSGVRLRDGELTDLGSGALDPARPVLDALPVARWERTHHVGEDALEALRQRAESLSGRAMPDLNLHYRLFLAVGSDVAAAADALNALEVVEYAWPLAQPAPPPKGPDYAHLQTYLDFPSPGVGSRRLWPRPGGTGRRVKVVDIEYEFTLHPDLPNIPTLGPVAAPTVWGPDHAVAVLGMLFALPNDEGVTGIAYGADPYHGAAYTFMGYNVAAAITNAIAPPYGVGVIDQGDVLLLEQQMSGPNGPGQFVPIEWDFSVYQAIQSAVGMGIHVVEAAGNGGENLDDPIYDIGHRPFTPGFGSGAILVGAGMSTSTARMTFSTYGSRVDVQAWGQNVVTTGYGDLPGGYTGIFSGTSSASAMVAGIVAQLASTFEEGTQWPIAPATLLQILKQTGTAQVGGGGHIGPRPNLVAALTELQLWRTGDDDEWSSFYPMSTLVGREGAAMCYDSARARMVLFGGDDGSWSPNQETWAGVHIPGGVPDFDWQPLPYGPPGRKRAAMAYDAKRDRVVLFGGNSFGVDLGDTWEFDGKQNVWSLVATGGPAPRSGHAMAYDPLRQRVVLVGGDCGGCGGTYEWDGSSWVFFAGPTPRAGAGLVWDVDRSRMVLFGGRTSAWVELSETWERTSTTWSLVTLSGPSPRSFAGLAYDTSRRRTVLHGGAVESLLQLFGDTWEWNGLEWRQAPLTVYQPERAGHSMAYDQALGRVVAYGGRTYAQPYGYDLLLRERAGIRELGSPYCFGDGTGATCPCGASTSRFEGVGCLNSTGRGGKLRGMGQASLQVGSHPAATAILKGSGMPNMPALYLQGTLRIQGGSGVPFGAGLRCAGGAVVRLGVKMNVNGASQYPGPSDPPLHVRGAVTEPGIRLYQIWYRDPAGTCGSLGFNFSNAIQVVWGL